MQDVGLSLKLVLLLLMGLLSIVFILFWLRVDRTQRQQLETRPDRPTFVHVAIGFVTNFFDTLGIGSFATTTAAFKLLRLVRDELIPGTMIIGHTLPVVAQAFIFIQAVTVDPVMLVLLIIAALAGAWLGAGIVSSLPRRLIQLSMGIGLLMAAASLLMSQFGLFPAGGESLNLSLPRLLIALVMNFVFGALATAGIGNYAPCLVLFSLLGLHPRAIFPVMMGSGGFMGVVAGMRFLKKGRYSRQAALGLLIGGIPGVLLAAFAVKSLSLGALRWMVVVVILYTSLTMLRSAREEKRQARTRLAVEGEVP